MKDKKECSQSHTIRRWNRGIVHQRSACSTTFSSVNVEENPSLPSIATVRMCRRMLHVSNLNDRIDMRWLRSISQMIGIVEHITIERDHRSREPRNNAVIILSAVPASNLPSSEFATSGYLARHYNCNEWV